MRTGGGGRGSHAVRQAPHPHNIEMHQLPTKKRTVDDVQHAPLCSHTLSSTLTNTNRYKRCRAVDMKAGGDRHGAHAVRQATHLHQNKQSTQQRTVVDVQLVPRCSHARCSITKRPTHKHNDAVSIWGSEEASLGHTCRDKSLTHTKQSNTHKQPTNTRLPTCSMRP
jgi:hypothetical protein